VKEQSHKDEMSAALKADFARRRDRGVSATLVPHAAPPRASDEPEPVTEPPVDAERPEPRRSWLARLAGL
jgi:hypothetical protein